MKHLTKSIGKCLSLMLALIMCMSLSIPAFAAEERIVSDEEIAAVLDKLNAEYHTNIHALSAAELTQLGLPVTNPEPMTVSELAELENTLRNIAETHIPQFKRNTQEAFIAIANIGMYNLLSKIPNSDDILPWRQIQLPRQKKLNTRLPEQWHIFPKTFLGKVFGEKSNAVFVLQIPSNPHGFVRQIQQSPELTAIVHCIGLALATTIPT